MKTVKKLFFIIPLLAGVLVLTVAVGLLLATLLDYRPPESLQPDLINPTGNMKVDDASLTLMTWNIGYAGLGKEMDFFYDGGKQVRPSRQLNESYLNSILEFLSQKTDIDFILLQEVDKKSKRSYRSNQVLKIANTFPDHCFSFAKNYDVPFVPVPPTNPMGKVKSGLMTLSLTNPESSERISFPGNFAWPKSLFMLDRCFLVQRFKTAWNKELILINTHNSAFDDGQLRQQQMEMLRTFAWDEYQKGNFVIIGGDWNQNPPGFNPALIASGDISVKNDLGSIPNDFMPEGWAWAYDPSVPTNRFVDHAYIPGETPATIIDFFLLSPNIEVVSVKTSNLTFNFSDHNPVNVELLLKQ